MAPYKLVTHIRSLLKYKAIINVHKIMKNRFCNTTCYRPGSVLSQPFEYDSANPHDNTKK